MICCCILCLQSLDLLYEINSTNKEHDHETQNKLEKLKATMETQ